jgi:hypothetical protein
VRCSHLQWLGILSYVRSGKPIVSEVMCGMSAYIGLCVDRKRRMWSDALLCLERFPRILHRDDWVRCIAVWTGLSPVLRLKSKRGAEIYHFLVSEVPSHLAFDQ